MKRFLVILSILCVCALLCCACTKNDTVTHDPSVNPTESQSADGSENPSDTPTDSTAGTEGGANNATTQPPDTDAYGNDWTYDY